MLFKMFGNEISYKDILQLDGAFSVCHMYYGESPIFNKLDGKEIIKDSRIKKYHIEKNIKNITDVYSFNGTEKNFKIDDRLSLWKNYFLEYVNAFDKLIYSLPKSVVTICVGRQAIELGFKYLLLKKTGKIVKEHDLKKLSNLVYYEYKIDDSYMKDVDVFCELYCKYIEGENVEYFRFPEYKGNSYFAGNNLDINWLSYNFALVILKLIHFASLDDEF